MLLLGVHYVFPLFYFALVPGIVREINRVLFHRLLTESTSNVQLLSL